MYITLTKDVHEFFELTPMIANNGSHLTKHVYAQICAWNVRTNDFKNKSRFTKKFVIKCIINLRKNIGYNITETTHKTKSTYSLQPYNHVKNYTSS